jgi:hypothetical protein
LKKEEQADNAGGIDPTSKGAARKTDASGGSNTKRGQLKRKLGRHHKMEARVPLLSAQARGNRGVAPSTPYIGAQICKFLKTHLNNASIVLASV